MIYWTDILMGAGIALVAIGALTISVLVLLDEYRAAHD